MPDREIDVRAEMDEAEPTRFHWLLIVLVFVAITFDGYDILAPSYVIHFVGKAWALSPSQQGFLVSAGLIGVAIGSVSHGVIADRFGRRPTMIGGLLISGVFSLVTALVADTFGSFVLLRLITGLGLGVIMPLGTAYINEYLPAKSRFRLATLAAAGFSLGGVGASVIGILFSQQYGWQVLFYVGSGAGVVALLFLAVFPESTEYLVAHGRTEEAARLMARLRPARAALYRDGRFAEIRPAGQRTRRDWRVPLSRPFLVSTMALWISSFLLLFVNYGLTAWTPNLMVARGDGFALGFGFGAALHSVPFVGGIVCGYLADRWLGRRGGLALWCGLGALTTLSMVVTYHPILNIIAIALAGFFLIGGQFMLNNTCAMTYPVHARGTGTGFMLGFGRFGGILGPYIGGALLGAFGTPDVLFIAAAAAGALAMACAAFIARPRLRPGAPAAVAVSAGNLGSPRPDAPGTR